MATLLFSSCDMFNHNRAGILNFKDSCHLRIDEVTVNRGALHMHVEGADMFYVTSNDISCLNHGHHTNDLEALLPEKFVLIKDENTSEVLFKDEKYGFDTRIKFSITSKGGLWSMGGCE
ncbi:MAG: hypothetical protein HWE14_03345 [Flavobacteriia bacterium]|nr:hypothetical protein [Flavobacteriia bacterium]